MWRQLVKSGWLKSDSTWVPLTNAPNQDTETIKYYSKLGQTLCLNRIAWIQLGLTRNKSYRLSKTYLFSSFYKYSSNITCQPLNFLIFWDSAQARPVRDLVHKMFRFWCSDSKFFSFFSFSKQVFINLFTQKQQNLKLNVKGVLKSTWTR